MSFLLLWQFPNIREALGSSWREASAHLPFPLSPSPLTYLQNLPNIRKKTLFLLSNSISLKNAFSTIMTVSLLLRSSRKQLTRGFSAPPVPSFPFPLSPICKTVLKSGKNLGKLFFHRFYPIFRRDAIYEPTLLIMTHKFQSNISNLGLKFMSHD